MLFDSLENKSKQNERKLRELKLRFESLSREIEQFFKEMGTTPAELSQYAQNPDNFSPREWDELKKKQKALEDQLENELKSIRDVQASKKSFEENNVSRHWIFCK